MANAIASAGCKIQREIASVFTDVAEVVGIGGPQVTVGDIDVTHLQSPNQFKEFIPGWGDGGVVTIEANFTKAQLNSLYGTIRTVQNWKIVFSDLSNWAFSGYINAISTDTPLEEEVQMPFSIKVTTKPVFTQ